MKKLHFAGLAILCIFLIVTPFFVQGKGAKVEKVQVFIELRLDNGETFGLYGDGTMVNTPSSNFLKTYKFRVPKDILELIDFGPYPNKIIGVRLALPSGEELIGIGFLNKAGNLNFNVHRNGAGGYFPKGWF